MTSSGQDDRVLPCDKNQEREGWSGGQEKLERDGTPQGEQNLIAREHQTINKRASGFTSPLLFCGTAGAKLLVIYGDSPPFLLASVDEK
ncbi:unnamed protein product [Lasius platythorax]|uniref:Uncharacterized protein n=1 Tax=Lasius platythorax TaxID=488582 RepID=A0AAV2N350_9HYME